MLDSLRAFQSDNDGFGSQSLRTAGNHQCWLVMNMSAVATPNHDTCGECAKSLAILTFVHSNSRPQSTRGINNGPKPLKKGVCCESSAAFFAPHCSGNNICGSS